MFYVFYQKKLIFLKFSIEEYKKVRKNLRRMEKAFELHRHFLNMKEDFLRNMESSDDELSIHPESEGEPYTMDSECDLSVPNHSENDTDDDVPEIIEDDDNSTHTCLFDSTENKPKKYIYMYQEQGVAKYQGTVYKVDKELEFERSTKYWSNRIWPQFLMKPLPKSLPNDISTPEFYEYVDIILRNQYITTMENPYFYLHRAGSNTTCHLIPADFMSLLLIQEEFQNIHILQTFRTFFPHTYHSEWKVMNYEKYYFYMDKINKKYEDEDEDDPIFIEKYQFLNTIFVIYMMRSEISNRYYHFLENNEEPFDRTKSYPYLSTYGYPYPILVKMIYLIHYLYSKEIYPDLKSMLEFIIPVSNF